MRSRDIRLSLFDMIEAADAIASFTSGRDLVGYRADPLLRSAVERQLEILGEATRRTLDVDPLIEASIPAARRVIDLRNVITHGYDVLDDSRIWDVAVRLVPELRDAVRTILGAHDSGRQTRE